ncbi:agmatine deiminase family protein [Halosquirtibacter laminarini]|uniref:Agmatine deiminase family protein n=1 Tax=Halosquirtibacter laminarini TaxID=3374600 RepID=A0AC61NIN2_9BACT|nr:agmatine deiminase family protein [Prolixibacteraceae bacterium]
MIRGKKRWPAEWEKQSVIQLTWPHLGTDWADVYEEILDCYKQLVMAITQFQPLLVVAQDIESVESILSTLSCDYPTKVVEVSSNDTWARDHAPLSIFHGEKREILDYKFNGWGLKFASNLDNLIGKSLYKQRVFHPSVERRSNLDFVLEGGAVESDGAGTCMTTTTCLLSENRNETYLKEDIEARLSSDLGVDHFLWLESGALQGDDTDSHIDTLARFVSKDTIVYQSCDDPNDDHYKVLDAMKKELSRFRDRDGQPYNLVALPWPSAKYDEKMRLPATYANFLILNGAVLVPTYQDEKDEEAVSILQDCFPERKVIGIDCRVLIKQHGSLHCVTMQYPEGFILM